MKILTTCSGGSVPVVLCRIILITIFAFCASSVFAQNSLVKPEIAEQDKAEAAKFISEIKSKTDNSGSEIEDAQTILDKSDYVREEAIKYYKNNLKEVEIAADKAKSNKEYQDWAKKSYKEAMKKQAQPLPKVDYDISQQELEKDALAKLLKSYRLKPDETNPRNQVINNPLMIFVSASIPKSSLKDLMVQAQQVGGILVFRGVIGSIRNTQQFLGSLAKENVSAVIDPRLFDIFQVKVVPTFVVLAKRPGDCDGSDCNTTPLHDRISGNITLHYALEKISEGDGNAKEIAKKFLVRMSPEGQGGQK